jgi:arginase
MTVNHQPIVLLSAPYDSGHYGKRMGAGPLALAGAADRLRERGHPVREQSLSVRPEWQAELETAFELHRLIAVATTGARAAGEVPVLLSGNCNATLGVLAGLSASVPRLGLVWFDAHGDFNTPETDANAYLDGQGLAMITGRGWPALTASVPGFHALPDDRVLMIGTRALDEREAGPLHESGITTLAPAQARDSTAAIAAFAERVDAVHIHLDLDAYDPSIAPANSYAAPDGLFPADVDAILHELGARTRISSATLASWDPAHDIGHRLRDVALDVVDLLAALARPA